MMNLMQLIASKKKSMQKAEKTERLPDGSSEWRLMLNHIDPEAPFWHDFGQHYIKGPDGKVKAVFTCHDRTFNTTCAVCSAIEQGISNTHDDKILQALKDSKAGGRMLVNAICISSGAKEPAILELPPTVFEDVLGIIQQWGTEQVLGLESAHNIVFEKTGKGLQTRYNVQLSPKKSSVSQETWKKCHDLKEFVSRESLETERKAIATITSVAGAIGYTPPSMNTNLSEVIDVEPDGTLEVDNVTSSVTTVETTGDEDLDKVLSEIDQL